jgi:hypothetical protein
MAEVATSGRKPDYGHHAWSATGEITKWHGVSQIYRDE